MKAVAHFMHSRGIVFDDYNHHARCLAHIVNLAAKAAIQLLNTGNSVQEDMADEEDFEGDMNAFEADASLEEDLELDDLPVHTYRIIARKGFQMKMLIHVQQDLPSHVEMLELEDENEEEAENIPFTNIPQLDDTHHADAKHSLFKIRAGIRKIRSSTINRHHWTQLCEETNIKCLMPILDVTVRWSSTFNMLNRILSYKSVSACRDDGYGMFSFMLL